MLTEGRLNDGITPSFCKVTNMVAPFMGEPLSECSTRGEPAMPSRRYVLRTNEAALFADSVSEDLPADDFTAINIHDNINRKKALLTMLGK